MVELYKINCRIGRAMPTGIYEPTGTGGRREVSRYVEKYETDMGMLTLEEWRRGLSKAIETDREGDVLKILIDHCKKHCAWLHREQEIMDYAMRILASRAFLCGNEVWKEVGDRVKNRYFLFTFEGEGYDEGQKGHGLPELRQEAEKRCQQRNGIRAGLL